MKLYRRDRKVGRGEPNGDGLECGSELDEEEGDLPTWLWGLRRAARVDRFTTEKGAEGRQRESVPREQESDGGKGLSNTVLALSSARTRNPGTSHLQLLPCTSLSCRGSRESPCFYPNTLCCLSSIVGARCSEPSAALESTQSKSPVFGEAHQAHPCQASPPTALPSHPPYLTGLQAALGHSSAPTVAPFGPHISRIPQRCSLICLTPLKSLLRCPFLHETDPATLRPPPTAQHHA